MEAGPSRQRHQAPDMGYDSPGLFAAASGPVCFRTECYQAPSASLRHFRLAHRYSIDTGLRAKSFR